jgi:hypothetical protein
VVAAIVVDELPAACARGDTGFLMRAAIEMMDRGKRNVAVFRERMLMAVMCVSYLGRGSKIS